MNRLITTMKALDLKPFRVIQSLKGTFRYPFFQLKFLRIQGSPGAHPASIAAIHLNPADYGFPVIFLQSRERKRALAEFLIRRFHEGIRRFARQNRGADGSGSFHTVELSQVMLERDAVVFNGNRLELRFIVSFPSRSKGGGSFDAEQAVAMLDGELNRICSFTFDYLAFDDGAREELEAFASVLEDRRQIEAVMQKEGWVAFIPDGSVIPRRSGVDDRPMGADEAIEFNSPNTLKVTIPLETKPVSGMALKEGVTVITGGGFHGKSTLQKALERGVYPHIPGDGRERIVTRQDAVMIRSEEGRSVRRVDISAFVRDIPGGKQTHSFSTENASGSTSQAANIMEALEVGSRLLLFDEDSCATNFLVRDQLIRKIIPPDREPVKPLYDAARSLWEQHDISSVLVVGGLGIFLKKADTVLLLDEYRCMDGTSKVRSLLGNLEKQEKFPFDIPAPRELSIRNFDPSYTNTRLQKTAPVRIKPLRKSPGKLEYGMDLIDLKAIPQLVEAPQTQTIGMLILELRKKLAASSGTGRTMRDMLEEIENRISEQGLSIVESDYPGTLSKPRLYELAAAVNRMRSLKITGL